MTRGARGHAPGLKAYGLHSRDRPEAAGSNWPGTTSGSRSSPDRWICSCISSRKDELDIRDIPSPTSRTSISTTWRFSGRSIWRWRGSTSSWRRRSCASRRRCCCHARRRSPRRRTREAHSWPPCSNIQQFREASACCTRSNRTCAGVLCTPARGRRGKWRRCSRARLPCTSLVAAIGEILRRKPSRTCRTRYLLNAITWEDQMEVVQARLQAEGELLLSAAGRRHSGPTASCGHVSGPPGTHTPAGDREWSRHFGYR